MRELLAPEGKLLEAEEVARFVAEACPAREFRDKSILLIVPDGTRTAPVEMIFRPLFEEVGQAARALDALVALGTHQPMSEEAICRRLGIPPEQRASKYRKVRFFNHDWNNPAALKEVGTLSPEEVRRLSRGLFALEVRVEVNRLLFEYDQVIIIGPVFPHEVVGFSGGNKYLFPGVAGPEILNFFHWLGAVITTPRIIGHKQTPVRDVVDRAAALVNAPKSCFAMTVEGDGLAGLWHGTPEEAWDRAADLSARKHVVYKDRPYKLILACAPTMYDELWTAAKCMYKLEPVLADGGELIIYAPHLNEICVTHGKTILEVGYHCRDYFLKQWDRFRRYPWGVLAHSTHVYGQGTFEGGIERPRARVTLATRIPEEICRRVNLGYRNPDEIRPEDYAGREDEGILMVPKAGETLYRLKNPPEWAKPFES